MRDARHSNGNLEMQTMRPLCLCDHTSGWGRDCVVLLRSPMPYAQLRALCPSLLTQTYRDGRTRVMTFVWRGMKLCTLPIDSALPADLPWFDPAFTQLWGARDVGGAWSWKSLWPLEFHHVARAQALVRPDSSEQSLWTQVDRLAAARALDGPTTAETVALRKLRIRLHIRLLAALREPGLVRHIMVACGGTISWSARLPGLRRNILETDIRTKAVRYVRGSLTASPCGVGFSQANTKRELLHLAAVTRACDDQPSLSWTKPEIARHLLRD